MLIFGSYLLMQRNRVVATIPLYSKEALRKEIY
jgi:hypothetical protein